MKNSQEVSYHYDSHAKYYEMWQGLLEGGYHFGFPLKLRDVLNNSKMIQNLNDLVIKELDVSESQKILDAGCGKGQVMHYMERSTQQKNLELFGVTLSKEQYNLGKAFLGKNNSSAQIFLEDFEKTHFPDNYFDHVLFIDSMCHGEGSEKMKALQEASRVLRPNGKLLVSDVFLQKHPRQSGRYFNFINDRVKKAWAVDVWITEKEFLCQAAKFQIIKRKEIDLTWKIPPSVMYAPFKWLPTAVIKSLYDEESKVPRKTLFNIGFFAPPLGMHPNFRYKLMVLEKTGAGK